MYRFFDEDTQKLATRVIAAAIVTLSISGIVIAYLGIFILLRKHAKKMRDNVQLNYLQNQSRASRTSLIIVVAVVVMNGPTFIYTIMLSLDAAPPSWFCTLTIITLLGSSSLNPLVYCLVISTIKKHVLLLIGCWRTGRKEEEGDDEERVRMRTVSSATRGDINRWTVSEYHDA